MRGHGFQAITPCGCAKNLSAARLDSLRANYSIWLLWRRPRQRARGGGLGGALLMAAHGATAYEHLRRSPTRAPRKGRRVFRRSAKEAVSLRIPGRGAARGRCGRSGTPTPPRSGPRRHAGPRRRPIRAGARPFRLCPPTRLASVACGHRSRRRPTGPAPRPPSGGRRRDRRRAPPTARDFMSLAWRAPRRRPRGTVQEPR